MLTQGQPGYWFFFGSLMDGDILSCVLGRSAAEKKIRAAVLPGFERLCLADETYPALKPRPDSQVQGVLVAGLSEEEGRRVCFFEGEEFRLQICSVHLLSDHAVTVKARVFLPGAGLRFDRTPWDFARWQRDEKEKYLSMTQEFMAGYGRSDWAELDQRWRAAQCDKNVMNS